MAGGLAYDVASFVGDGATALRGWNNKGERMDMLKNMKLAGWLAVSSVILTIPALALSIFSGFMAGTSGSTSVVLTVAEMAVSGVNLLITVAVLLCFKNLLNSYLNITSVDFTIKLLVAANVVLVSLSIAAMPFAPLDFIVGVASLVLLVPYGIIHTVFGVKVLRVDDELYGLRTPFAILTIITGICFATVVLLLIGVVTSMIWGVLMAIIFFRAARLSQCSEMKMTLEKTL